MSKYYKVEDVDLVCIKNFASGDVLSAIRSLPTIEVMEYPQVEGITPTLITTEVSEDCISRADLIERFLSDNECKREEAKACMCSLDLVLELIEDATSVVPSRAEGEWIDCQEDGYVSCPFCGCDTTCDGNKDELKFCWNCGAKMKGVKI